MSELNSAPADEKDSEPVIGSIAQDMGPVLRLHPLSILTRFIARLPQFIYIIPALIFGSWGEKSVYILPFILVVITLTFLVPWVYWSRFTYQIGSQEIRVKSGILSKKNRSIPFERIQDVNLEQKMISRIFGLATVKLETGGSGGNEGKFDALLLSDAEELRDLVKDRKAGLIRPSKASSVSDADDKDSVKTTSADRRLFAMNQRRILLAGLFNFSFVLLAVFAAVAQNLDFLLPDDFFRTRFFVIPEGFFDPRYWWAQLVDQDLVNGFNILMGILSFVAAALGLVIIGTLSGLGVTYIREYGFTLDRTDTGLRRRRGLFTLTDVAMPLHRIQAVIIQTGPIRKFFGWYHLKAQSLASDGKGNSDHSLAPLSTLNEIDYILAEPNIKNDRSAGFQQVDPSLWWLPCLIFFTLTTLLTVIASVNGSAISLVGFIAMGPIALFSFLRWKYHLFAQTTEHIMVRSGFWRRKLTILPIRKVQTVDLSQRLFDHQLGLATLVVGVAGGSVSSPLKIKALPLETAYDLRRKLIGLGS